MNFLAFVFLVPAATVFAVSPIQTSQQPKVSNFEELKRSDGKSVYTKHVIFAVRSENQNQHKDNFQSDAQFQSATSLAEISPAETVRVGLATANRMLERYDLKNVHIALNTGSLLVDSADQIVSFDVFKNNLLVEDAFISVQFKNGVLRKIFDQSFLNAQFESTDFVTSNINMPQAKRLGSAYRIIKTNRGYEGILVEKFLTNTTDYAVVQIENRSQKIFEIDLQNVNLDGTIQAHVYENTYLSAAKVIALPFLQVATNIFTNKLGSFSLPESSPSQSVLIDGLRGKYVSVNNKSGSSVKASADLTESTEITLDFTKDDIPTNKQQAQIMGYSHVNKMMAYAREYLNIPWLQKNLNVNVNLESELQKCNAFWDRRAANINFFEDTEGKCANAGLFADIMYHEWGHGLHQNAGGIKDSALSEGFGDTLAILMTKRPKLAEGFINARKFIRNAEDVVTYPPENPDVGPHRIGMSLSGSMWELYKSLLAQHGDVDGQKIFAKLAFKMIFIAKSMEQAYDAVQSIDASDAVEKGPHFCLINRAFASRTMTELSGDCKL